MEWEYDDLIAWNDMVGNIPNVTKLNISCNNLTELPQKIFKLISLHEFYCYYNKLTELPKEIGQLTSLQIFSCDNNELTKLPKEIGQLTLLNIFSCHHNKLTELPKEIGQLVSLRKLFCNSNQIHFNVTITQYMVCRNLPHTMIIYNK